MKTKLIERLSMAQGARVASLLSLLLSLMSLPALSATSAEATTGEFRLSIKHDGVRASAGEESLRYSPLWDGGSNETAKVTLKQGDAVLSENLTAEGGYAWSVSANGTYNLTHTTYTNGAVAKVLNATFVVTGKDQPFPPGSVTATGYNGKFDGKGHGITVTTTDIANPSITYARTEAGPYTETNPLFTNVCNETVWYVVAAPGYITETNSATVVITNGDIGGGGGDEPGGGEIPEGGLSKFDATYVYDGEGHTINTQALFAVTLPGATPSFSFATTENGTYQPDPMVYTNVGEYVIWYQITAPNYSPYKHQAKVTIEPRVEIKSINAIPRYPWQGVVDVDLVFTGRDREYLVTLTAIDSIGKTNLTVNTVRKSGSSIISNPVVVRPGRCRIVWESEKDIKTDIDFDEVQLGVKVEERP